MDYLRFSDFQQPENLIFYDPIFNCGEFEYLILHAEMYQRRELSYGVIYPITEESFI